MQAIIRGVLIYFFLLLITRIAGRRTMGEMTSFDFVLLLVIGEATQQALLGRDFSSMNACVVIATLVTIDILLSLLKQKFPRIDTWIEGVPTVLVEDGKLHADRLRKSRLDRGELLEAARRNGLSCFEEILHAVLERDGSVTVIGKK